MVSFAIVPVFLIGIVTILFSTIKILREYERAVVFTLGRFQKVKGPGLVLLIPFIQEMVRVDLRIQVVEIPSQDVISHDNVSMKVDAVLYFNVVNPERAIIQVQNYLPATNMLAQTTLRAVLGQHELDEMLSERKKLSTDIQGILDTQTEIWGIKVSNVERPNVTGARRSFTPKRNSRHRRRWLTRRRSLVRFRPRCSSAISRR
jgi:regulator of protease activity HflC (stomatin/prohibitin superfamily)